MAKGKVGTRFSKGMREFWARLRAFARELVLSPYRAFLKICTVVGFITIVVSAGIGIGVYSFFASLPDLHEMSFQDLKKVAEARVAERREQKGRVLSWTPLRDVSRDFLYTIVMSEDSLFFQHGGVDYEQMATALAENIKSGEYQYGASTISQQVVKNLFLNSSKSLLRKVKEVLITRDLERYFSKNEILELYLNAIEVGPDLYGVREAAGHYFGKKPSQINAAEGAFVALMLPSPRKNHYAIFQNQNLTDKRRKKIRRILADMLHNEFITLEQYREYIRYPYFEHAGRSIARKRKGR